MNHHSKARIIVMWELEDCIFAMKYVPIITFGITAFCDFYFVRQYVRRAVVYTLWANLSTIFAGNIMM